MLCTKLALATFAATSTGLLEHREPAPHVQFSYRSNVSQPVINFGGSWQRGLVGGSIAWIAMAEGTVTYVEPDGSLKTESFSNGGAVVERGGWTLLLNTHASVAAIDNGHLWPAPPLGYAALAGPCPDGSPPISYGASASQTPNQSDCWQYAQLLQEGVPVADVWTCTKPDGEDGCSVDVTDGINNPTHSADCGSANFRVTVYYGGRIFVCP